MGINLKKGQGIDLEKKNPGLKKVFMGLGWDPVEKKKGGFLGGLLGGGKGGGEIDLDASVIVMDKNLEIVGQISFQNLRNADRSIVHSGDNRTGAGEGDDEVIHVNLENMSPDVAHLVFTVNAFTGETFDDVDNAHCRLVDEASGQEICSYKLTEHGRHTAVVMASLSRTASGWQMTAHGEPGRGRTVQDLYPQAQNIVAG